MGGQHQQMDSRKCQGRNKGRHQQRDSRKCHQVGRHQGRKRIRKCHKGSRKCHKQRDSSSKCRRDKQDQKCSRRDRSRSQCRRDRSRSKCRMMDNQEPMRRILARCNLRKCQSNLRGPFKLKRNPMGPGWKTNEDATPTKRTRTKKKIRIKKIGIHVIAIDLNQADPLTSEIAARILGKRLKKPGQTNKPRQTNKPGQTKQLAMREYNSTERRKQKKTIAY